MKLLLWIGNESNQKALANKLAEEFNVIGIVTEKRLSKRKITLRKVFDSAFEKLFLPSINNAWLGMKDYYNKQYPDFPKSKRIDVENINSEDAFEFSKKLNPDLIIVSGTRLVKSKMLSIKTNKGILNLHTGLSPYVKGGPNCTNWCIATNQFHIIGNTIMWIDEGIDSGNIVTTEFSDINWSDTLLNIHISVMEHAHALYLKAVKYISQENNSNVEQSKLGEGKTYYSKEWKLKNKINLIINLKKHRRQFSKEGLTKKRKNIKIVEITIDNKT
ncbi:MAG: hypothetical protein CL846_01900 [Crocinitomicaceae bacterium]|nr:hypothetical protein [Crocinitomicaceae bacterium]|tara:strand:- start:4577 stop:5398 length:822 start_codon:yes stop_codon:yes gene_type:complete